MQPQSMGLQNIITDEAFHYVKNPNGMIHDVMRQALDMFFDALQKKPYLKLVGFPSMMWSRDEQRMVYVLRMEATVVEDPEKLILWQLEGLARQYEDQRIGEGRATDS